MEDNEERSGAQSRVASATARDDLNVEQVEKDSSVKTTALNICWAYGINRQVPAHNLSDGKRKMVFFVNAHAGVLFNFEENKQQLLQGHSNAISCTCVSEDRRWIATADKGSNNMVIVWDSFTGIPVQTMFDPHPDGCAAIAMSPDAKYIATISNTLPQTVLVWDWTVDGDTPMCSTTLDGDYGMQTFITFNADDTSQLVSNSTSQVVFYSLVEGSLEFVAPPLTDKDFNRSVGQYSQSVFQDNCTRALTATSCGNIVVWEHAGKGLPCNRKAFKIVKLQDKALTVLTTAEKYIVTGDMAGHVRFLDQQLRLSNWYKHFEAGPINSVSFSYTPKVPPSESSRKPQFPASSTLDATPFIVNDFTVSTFTANVGYFSPTSNNFQFLRQEHDSTVNAIACHPTDHQLCIGSYSGLLQVWDYQNKTLVNSRQFDRRQLMIQCIAFSPPGDLIALGFTDGSVRVLDAITLRDEGCDDGVAVFNHCHDCVTHIKFSHDSKYIASADLDRCVTIFKFQPDDDVKPWVYVGKQRAHYKSIADISFGVALDSTVPRLLSVGHDRVLVEYDLESSTTDDVRLLGSDRIEQSAVPQCLAWYPPIVKENFLVIANDQFKMKLINSTTKMCRRTLLGPTYGTPLKKVVVLPAYDDRETRYMTYITMDKVGLQILPLDGNPHKTMSLIAHPDNVTNLACSFDGKYIFTAGGQDCSVLMWQVNLDALEAAARLGGEDLVPFYGLLEGGRDGELFAELEDYFYYAQIRDQGVDTTDTRKTSVKVPLNQVPYIMRALGFYPSEQEIEDMINEVKFSNYVETGKYVTHIDLGDFIKLYVNHRPAFGLSPMELHDAFNHLGEPSDEGFQINRDQLLALLQNKGEHMTEAELAEYMSTLMGIADLGGSAETGTFDASNATAQLSAQLPEFFTADSFAAQVIGFGGEELEAS
ncbi:cilia- and flagella-associated protein 251 [Nematostella vectensis]|uniref:cilia- and flagella-associated protein 251 n=1 Tax=Nematostella vectensis TaxID=45351 RepID=UPI0020774F8B|nr:cilia- and flagella-associated protein 251 [Nematostella vectensis]